MGARMTMKNGGFLLFFNEPACCAFRLQKQSFDRFLSHIGD